MLICALSEPFLDGAWKEVVQFDPVEAAPCSRLLPESPRWKERVIEVSLLRRPEVLARAIGRSGTDILALKQVWRIDLYLRVDGSLHLFEVKKPTAYGEHRKAATQIARQYCERSVWLRRGDESVNLWAVCPVEWSQSDQAPMVPSNWQSDLNGVRAELLKDQPAISLELLFYAIARGPDGRFVFFWRADEASPRANRD